MITVNCPKCGGAADIDEKREESVVCKHCKTVITLEKAAPEKYKELIEAREKTEQRYKNILKDYEGGNDAPLKNAMHKIISSTDTSDFNINRWFDFIFNAVNIGIKKKDTTNLEILKAHARRFDDAYSDYNAGDRRLYDSLVFLHPEILSESEWKTEFEKASADKADVRLLQNNILKCVKEKKDPKLLISVLNVLSAFQEDFKEIGEEFLNSILDDEDIAKILSVSFFKKARGGNFAKKLKKYVSSTFKEAEVILKDTLVWNNAEKVQKQRKKQKIIIASSVLAVIAATVLAIFLFRNATVKDSIQLEKPQGNNAIIKMVYSESPDLSGYTIVFKKNDGTEERVQVTPDMLSGYDKEKMGTQAAKITYKGKTFDVNIEVIAKQLEKTTVSITENKLVWERVANAEGYDIYLSKASGAVGVSKYGTVEDKESNATLVFDLTAVNDMGNVFYATVVAYNTTDKYSDSEKSDEIKVTKLSVPTNIKYVKDSKKLTWNAVEGAASYTVEINNAPAIRDIQTTEIVIEEGLSVGDNSITVTAFPTEQNVIKSISKVNIHKLSQVETISYVGNEVKWNTNSKSSYYNVSVNGETSSEQTGNTLDVSTWQEGLYTLNIEVVSKSDVMVTSESREFKIYVGTKLDVANGKINWTAFGGSSYNIYVNGECKAEATNETFREISSFVTEANKPYTFYIEVVNGGISETVTVKKLSAPTLTVLSSKTLKVTGNAGASCDITYNHEDSGENPLSDMDLKKLINPGNYVITAVNKAANNYEIDSDATTITVTKLEAPTISADNGELCVDGVPFVSASASVKWFYSDGTPLNGPSFITPNVEYTFYAIAKATGTNQLDSEKSKTVTVTKLPKPTLSYDGDSEITCTTGTVTGGTLTYYKNGVVWDGNMNGLEAGENKITAKYVSSSKSYLNSEPSNEILIVKTEVELIVGNAGDNISVTLNKGSNGLKYEIEVKWFNGTTHVSTAKIQKTEFNETSSVTQYFTKQQPTAEITVKIYDSQDRLVDTKKWPEPSN